MFRNIALVGVNYLKIFSNINFNFGRKQIYDGKYQWKYIFFFFSLDLGKGEQAEKVIFIIARYFKKVLRG